MRLMDKNSAKKPNKSRLTSTEILIFSSLHKEFIWVMLFWLQQYQQLYYQLVFGFVAVGMTRRKMIAKHPVRHIGKQLRY